MKTIKIISIFIIIPCIVLALMYGYNKFDERRTITNSYDQIDYILSFMRNGQLYDYANKIGMKNPDSDIRWYRTDDGVKIEYGYMTMNFPMEEFLSDKCTLQMGKIGITHKFRTTDTGKKLVLMYHDEELERWIE